jgi:tubulin polyglutamylase TTLL1/tubulin monoglycylase TTLL3/8
MLTSVNSIIKGYWYEDGYLRTSSQPFSLQNLKSKFVHLTNDAVQCHAENYGKFENGNKLSYQTF